MPHSTISTVPGPLKLGDPAMLEKIDQLFATGVDKQIPLPQLVVVGEQSSGKSSVLAGLTELPFACDSTLCTRFPTQIIFKRTLAKKIFVSIIGNGNESHNAEMAAWSKSNVAKLDPATFTEIMTEVNFSISPFRACCIDVV